MLLLIFHASSYLSSIIFFYERVAVLFVFISVMCCKPCVDVCFVLKFSMIACERIVTSDMYTIVLEENGNPQLEGSALSLVIGIHMFQWALSR